MSVASKQYEIALAQLVCAIVSIEFGVSTSDLLSASKGSAHKSFARQVAMYLMHVVFQVRVAGVGRAFGRDPSTASYACRIIEDEREDALFDHKLQVLEEFLNSAAILKKVNNAI